MKTSFGVARHNLPSFYLFLGVLLTWVYCVFVLANPNRHLTLDTAALISLALELLAGMGTILCIHSWLRSERARTLLGGLSFLWAICFLLDAYLLGRTHYTTMGLTQITLLGGDLKGTLDEVNLPAQKIILLLCSPFLIIGSGSVIYKVLSRWRLSGRWLQSIVWVTGIFWLAFVGEQFYSRQSDLAALRSQNLPFYLSVFNSGGPEYRLSIPERSSLTNEKEVLGILQSKLPQAKTKNVLFVLLESVRGDYVSAANSPILNTLKEGSINFPNARPEAISTVLVWHTLFMSEPPFRLEHDIGEENEVNHAAPMLELLKAAGYDLFVSVANNPSLKGEQQRLMGKNNDLGLFYSGFDGTYTARNLSDQRVVDAATLWLEKKRDTSKPFFAMVQFDGTHWPYQFSKDDQLFSPYASDDPVDELVDLQGISRVQNRYRNALHSVDHKIGSLLATLKKLKVDENTAVVVVSDHGEGFRIGNLAHLALTTDTRTIPYFLRLPGIPAGERSSWVTHRNLFPALFDYLGIKIPQNHFMMTSALDVSHRTEGTLTYNGSLNQANIDLGDSVLNAAVKLTGQEIVFTPLSLENKNGEVIPHWRDQLDRLPWKNVIKNYVE